MRLTVGLIVVSLMLGGAQTPSKPAETPRTPKPDSPKQPKINPPTAQAPAVQAPGRRRTNPDSAAVDNEKVAGIIVAQSDTSVTVLAKSDSGPPVRKTWVLDGDTKLRGAKTEWKIASAPKAGPEKVQYYDLRGKAGEFEVVRGHMKVAAMQSACDPDVCALKACAKKCGANACTCPAGK